MNQPARLLAEEINEARPLPLAHVGETSDPSETPQPPGRHHELARLISHGGGLDEPVDAEHERDGSRPVEGGEESVRMIGPINAFAPGNTFAVEARYLVARTRCLAKMERVLTCWWRRGLSIMLVGDMMLRDYPSWGLPLLDLGAEVLLADWNAQPEADKRFCGNEVHGQNCELQMPVVDTCWWLPGLTLMRMGELHGRHYPASGAAILRWGTDRFVAAWKARCEEERSREAMGVAQTAEVRLFERSSGVVDTHEPSVTAAPGLMAESLRVETPTPAVAASRAECTQSLAVEAPCVDEGVPVLTVRAPCIDIGGVAVDAPRTEDSCAMAVEAPHRDGAPVLVVEAPRAEETPVLAVEAPRAEEAPAMAVDEHRPPVVLGPIDERRERRLRVVDGPARGSQSDAIARPRTSARRGRPAERRASSAASLASTRVLMARAGRAITSATSSLPRGATSMRWSPTRVDGQRAAAQGPMSSRSVAASSTRARARWLRSERESSSAHWRSSRRISRPPRRAATLAKAAEGAAKSSPRRDTRWAATGSAAATSRSGNGAEPVRWRTGHAVAAIPTPSPMRRSIAASSGARSPASPSTTTTTTLKGNRSVGRPRLRSTSAPPRVPVVPPARVVPVARPVAVAPPAPVAPRR